MRVNGVADGITYFFEDDGDGNIYRFHFDSLNAKVIDDRNFGTVDYTKGEVLIGYTSSVTIVNTTVDNSTIEVRAIPKEQDIIASKTASINFDIAKSDIISVIDTQIAGS